MRMIFDIRVDKPVNAMQAVRAANLAIANSVTDNIISSLKKRYLGISDTHTETAISIKDGKYKKFDVKHKGNESSAN